ncbi:hypothetical protein [Galbitalea soli]|uniref:DUF4190 domain-containing protein n=1 Tax=Galbitalea soli TaxID=1268042 RepID=A0A7C9TPP1_9MICO|nr:hypothetical protein [Galbitalea soli]NEM90877.1 hypothetical protein [Galbitalea soli]NYJ31597.1 hypothetical protein [Galbitalea soli]
MIVGIVAAVFAIVPGFSFIAFIPAFTAIALGIVGLVRRHARRGRPLSGVVLGGVSLLVAVVVSVATIVGTAASSTHSLSAAAPTISAAPSDAPSDAASASPAESPSPSPSPAPVETVAPPAPVAKTYSGRHDSVIRVKLPDGADQAAIATISYTGGSNFSIFALDSNFKRGDLLVNTIGRYRGTVLVNPNGDGVTGFEISASGPWALTLKSISAARQMTGSRITGAGDDVLIYRGDASAAAIVNRGSSNFAVWQYGDSTDLLVNEIGNYTGTVLISGGPSLFAVSSDGKWSITTQ